MAIQTDEVKERTRVKNEAELPQRTLTLTSLAILKVDIGEHHRNYLDYLGPFVLNILTVRKPEVVTDEIIADLLGSQFGLKVPIKGIQHLLRHMVRQGHLKKESEVYFPTGTCPDVDLSAKQQEAAAQIQRVYTALCRFAPTVQPDFVWLDSDAAKAIVGFLGHFAVDCLRTYVFNTALPHVPESAPKDIYIVSRFLQNAHEHERFLFEDFIVLVKGQMYANALTCPDLQSLSQKFDRVTFYLDTPLVLNLLGLQGEGRKQAALELIALVRELRGSLAVFEHTVMEIKGVIHYSADHLDDTRITNLVLREIRSGGLSLADLIIFMDQLENRLGDNHIAIHPTPPYVYDVQIDQQAFEAALEEEIRYHGDHALQYDINSIRSIYVRRRGRTPVRLEDCMAVLVTPNSAFAKVAFEQGRTHNSSREVSTVVTDYSLANVAWLKAPMKRPDLPEKETLALCYAALEPSKELFQKYVKTMDELREQNQISADDHAILRSSPIAYRELMDFTLGDEEALTGRGMREIMDRVKRSLVEDHIRSTTEEKEKLNREHAEVTHNLELSEAILRAEMEAQNQRYRVEQEEKARVLSANEKRARDLSRTMTLVIMALASAILLLCASASSGLLGASAFSSTSYKIIAPCLAVIAVLWGWYNWITGKTLRSITKQIEHRMTCRLFKWFTGGSVLPGETPNGGQKRSAIDCGHEVD